MINENKYYKKALKALYLDEALKEYKTLEAFKKFLSEMENKLEVWQLSLETAKKNIPIAKKNIDILNAHILTIKEQLERDDIRYSKKEKELKKEKIDEYNYLIEDMLKVIDDAKKDIAELPADIENMLEWINGYLLLVEPQMKVERIADLNKNRKFEYMY